MLHMDCIFFFLISEAECMPLLPLIIVPGNLNQWIYFKSPFIGGALEFLFSDEITYQNNNYGGKVLLEAYDWPKATHWTKNNKTSMGFLLFVSKAF